MADDTDPPNPVDELLAAGRKVMDEARQTLAELDALVNTAVIPVIVPTDPPPEAPA